MLPYSFFFHSLSQSLMCLTLFCRRNILVPWTSKSSDHQMAMLFWKSGWESQIFSNPKGLLLGFPTHWMSSWTDQWSKPPKGRTLTTMSLSLVIRSSKIINLSSLEATWDSPPLLLFQVNVPLFITISTSFMLSMKDWKAQESLVRILVPPFFSDSVFIILKSPPRI